VPASMTAVAAILAMLALALTSPTPPPDFADGFASGEAVLVPGFTGWEWPCHGERCYAGLEISSDGNGGTVPVWTTGP
jgi:hypothetical protein